MQPDTRLSANADVIAREVGGEHVLLHLGTGTYYGLNEVGGRVWQLLQDGDRTLGELCAVVTEEFDAPADVVRDDLAALATSLAEGQLVTVA